MISLAERAAALRTVLSTQESGRVEPESIRAVLLCARELLQAGTPGLALDLLDLVPREDVDQADAGVRDLRLLRAMALRLTGRHSEALACIGEIRETSRVALPREFQAELSITEASCLWRMNRLDEAVHSLTRLREELLSRPDSELLARCTYELSSALLFAGDHQQARNMCLEAIVSSRRSGSRHQEALALENLHRLERAKCRWSAATEAGNEAFAIHLNSVHNKLSMGTISNGLGIVAWKAGRLPEAESLAARAIGLLAEAGGKAFEGAARLLLGMVHLHAGRSATAASVFGDTRAPSDLHGKSRLALLAREYLGDVHLEQGEAAEALKLYDEVLPKALALVPKGDIVAELRRRRAECYYLLGQFERAYEEALTGLKHSRELGDRYEEAATYRPLALAAAAIGRTAEAKSWFDQGFAYYEDIETPYEWGKLWLAYGDWLRGPHAGQWADSGAALEAYRAARDHFERMGAEAKLALADARIAALAPPDAVPSPATGRSASEIREKLRAPRRPRASSELERRGAWALETFGILSRHRALLDVLEQCSKLAAGRAPILVLGESGTGKELIAAGIHRISGRAGHYMPLNCASIPKEVFESELFGHMAGAFTGATRDKVGIVEACDGGTMFLDEVGEMPIELQARVLRFLESGEFRRVGATRNTRADTRLVAATNRDRNALKSGEGFRADLYYRLAHGVITLPPLRQRGDDIVLLVEHFLEQACAEAGKRIALADSAWARLGAHPWPGNVRELRAALTRLVALAHDGDVIEADHVELDDSEVPTNLLQETIVVEKRRIEEALRQAGGMKSEAARILGLSRTTLLSKMKRYGMME